VVGPWEAEQKTAPASSFLTLPEARGTAARFLVFRRLFPAMGDPEVREARVNLVRFRAPGRRADPGGRSGSPRVGLNPCEANQCVLPTLNPKKAT